MRKKKYNGRYNHRQYNERSKYKRDEYSNMYISDLDGSLRELQPRKRDKIKVEISDLPSYKNPWSEENVR